MTENGDTVVGWQSPGDRPRRGRDFVLIQDHGGELVRDASGKPQRFALRPAISYDLLEALVSILAYEDGGLTLDPDSYGAEVYAKARAAVDRAKTKS